MNRLNYANATLALLLPLALFTNHATANPPAAESTDEEDAVQIVMTPDGVRFGIQGAKPREPAATIFVMASDIPSTLQQGDYNRVGRLLRKAGVLAVAIDLPGHGQQIFAGDPPGLVNWAAQLRRDHNPVGSFTRQASAVLDYLVTEKYTDPARVAVAGTSRGGFMAFHFAAAEPRVRCVAAFAPVTELSVLKEFRGLEQHDLTARLALYRVSDSLASRPLWLCIGNHDERVGTDQAIAFTRQVVRSAIDQKLPPQIEIHVMTSVGHTIHATAHDEAAAWIASQLMLPDYHSG